MYDIEDAINKEMGSICQRSYMTQAFLFLLNSPIGSWQTLLLVFVAAPPSAFEYNPHAKNAVTIITEWDLSGDKSWISGFLNSIFFVGYMVGTLLIGQLSDQFGRKRVAWKVYTVLIVCSFTTAFCQTWEQMAACRVVSGFFVGGLTVVTAVYVQEMCAAQLWVVNGLLGAMYFTFGMLLYLLFAYFIPTWRTLCIAITLPTIVGYTFYIFVPESPRWLVSRGKLTEAENAIKVLARRNGAVNTDFQLIAAGESTGFLEKKPVKFSALDLIRFPILRHRTIILCVQWFTASFIYYSITLGAGAFSPNYYLAFAMSAVSELPAVFLCLYFMERKWSGRRRTLVGFMLLTAISMFLMYILPYNEDTSGYRLMCSFLTKIGTCGSFNIIFIYTPELYPTVVRNVGLGTMSMFSGIGSITAPFLANHLVNTNSQTPFIWCGILCGVSAVLASDLPETVGRKIPNTLEDASWQENG